MLPGRLVFDREERATAPGEPEVLGRRRRLELPDPPLDRPGARRAIEDVAGVVVLRLAPLLHLRVGPLLEPAVVVADRGAVVDVGDRPPGRRGRPRRIQTQERGQDDKGEQGALAHRTSLRWLAGGPRVDSFV